MPGSLTRQELVDRYADKTGRDVSGMLFYYCFGLYKIAVIIQQIYARYVRGHTRDERFSRLNERVAALGHQALSAGDREALKNLKGCGPFFMLRRGGDPTPHAARA